MTCRLDISTWTSIFAQQLNVTFHWTLNDSPIDDRLTDWSNDRSNSTNSDANSDDHTTWTILTNQTRFLLKNLTDFGLVRCWLTYNDAEQQRSYTSRPCLFLIESNEHRNEHRNDVSIINSSFFSASIDNDKNDTIDEKENDNEEEFISANHRCTMLVTTKTEMIEFYCSILGNYELIPLFFNHIFKLNQSKPSLMVIIIHSKQHRFLWAQVFNSPNSLLLTLFAAWLNFHFRFLLLYFFTANTIENTASRIDFEFSNKKTVQNQNQEYFSLPFWFDLYI